jgi:UDP-N-acetylmuramoylalanine--D-glutamate ligase
VGREVMSGFSVRGRRVVVVGAASSGLAAVRLLVSRGADVVLTDLKTSLPEADELRGLGVGLELGGHPEHLLAGADLVVVSPGVPLHADVLDRARAAGVPVIGEIELAFRWLRGRVIAITGTKGKSTTTTLVGRMLQAAGFDAPAGGNLGPPLSGQVDGSTPETLHVVECSSFQLETTDTFHPWIAAALNFSPDHLDRHASVEEYEQAKTRIFANQDDRDWCVVNADDAGALALARGARARRVVFTLDGAPRDGVGIVEGQIVRWTGGRPTSLLPVAAVQLAGRHMLADVLAASAMASLAGAGAQAIETAVRGFRALAHAMELVGESGGVRFINDSKATNIESARRSIESVATGLVVILGGRYKGGDFRDLRDPLAGRARAVVAIGEASGRVEDALADAVPVQRAGSLEEAVRLAYALARPQGTVVLAPACSSFDMFRDYIERGTVFTQEVQRLMAEGRARET